jgi:hypothetical protein
MHANSSVQGRAIQVDTQDGRDSIRQQLDRVLNSQVFRSSKRYPALLRYIVEQTLEGRESTIKERTLGVDVFGRSPDYDTNSDHVVRTAAGEVRKRLAQYYMEAGRELELRIEVPPGSYVPQFKTAPELAVIYGPRDEAITEAPPIGLRGGRRLWLALLIVSAILNVAFVLYLAQQTNIATSLRGEKTLQAFWAPVVRSGSPVLLCVGTRNGFTPPGTAQPGQGVTVGVGRSSVQTGTAGSGADRSQDALLRRVAMADVLTLARISAYVGSQRVPYRIMDPATMTFSDLRTAPAVLIGAGNNNWARQLTDPLRFSFTTTDPNAPDNVRPIAIRDSQHPENHAWVTGSDSPITPFKEYGLITRLRDQSVEQVVVIIGSLGAHATEAAGEFVTNPAQLRKLDAYTPTNWGNKNLQVVLSVEVVRGKSGPPKIEAAWFW